MATDWATQTKSVGLKGGGQLVQIHLCWMSDIREHKSQAKDCTDLVRNSGCRWMDSVRKADVPHVFLVSLRAKLFSFLSYQDPCLIYFFSFIYFQDFFLHTL